MRTTCLIASGGLSLMVANVLYAKLLVPEDFGRLILIQTVGFIAMGLLPLGLDNLIVRKEVATRLSTLGGVLTAGLFVAALIATFSRFYFDVGVPILLYILVSGFAGGATRLFAAVEQSELRFLRAQIISQAPLIVFLAAGVYHFLDGETSWEAASDAFVFSYVLGAVLGFALARTGRQPSSEFAPFSKLWVPALAFMGIYGSLLLLNQMERLVAAGALGLRELGALGLATTLIGSPFRLLSTGVGYTLMPRLKACDGRIERRRLVLHEFIVAMAFGIPGAVLLFLLVPPLLTLMFSDEYDITLGLIVSLLVLGLIRVNSGVVSATINALGDIRMLHTFNLTGWISAGVAAGAAFALQGFGSTGIVVGVTIGWLVRILWAAISIRREL